MLGTITEERRGLNINPGPVYFLFLFAFTLSLPPAQSPTFSSALDISLSDVLFAKLICTCTLIKDVYSIATTRV